MDFKMFISHTMVTMDFTRIFLFLIWSATLRFNFAEEFRQSAANIQSVSEAAIPPASTLVDLSYNQIITLRNGDFSGLNQLQHLYLIGNRITTIGKYRSQYLEISPFM